MGRGQGPRGSLVSRTVMTVAPVPHWPPPRFHSPETVTDGQPHNFPDPRPRPTFTFRGASALGPPASARTPCSGNEDHLLCIHVSESMFPGGAPRNAGQGPQVPQTEPGRWRMCQFGFNVMHLGPAFPPNPSLLCLLNQEFQILSLAYVRLSMSVTGDRGNDGRDFCTRYAHGAESDLGCGLCENT